eukprot:TRINITY_DN10_c0_g5_i1.p1 TRINITY_DN10_c0_g5~~TRINITY_DN10_c0_g5_i1.p1  ORF type:complete len:144 (+),score=34.80 TRINITY_DN10_c0_g5_i1:58-489(+)
MSTGRIDSVKDNVFEMCSRINSTWGGNLADMARAQKIFEIIEEEHMVENAAVVGEYLKAKLLELQKKFPAIISNVRGRGLMCAFDLPTAAHRNTFKGACMAKRMVILSSGARSLRFRPALNTVNADIDAVMRVLDSVCTDFKL